MNDEVVKEVVEPEIPEFLKRKVEEPAQEGEEVFVQEVGEENEPNISSDMTYTHVI